MYIWLYTAIFVLKMCMFCSFCITLCFVLGTVAEIYLYTLFCSCCYTFWCLNQCKKSIGHTGSPLLTLDEESCTIDWKKFITISFLVQVQSLLYAILQTPKCLFSVVLCQLFIPDSIGVHRGWGCKCVVIYVIPVHPYLCSSLSRLCCR